MEGRVPYMRSWLAALLNLAAAISNFLSFLFTINSHVCKMHRARVSVRHLIAKVRKSLINDEYIIR